ncbi:MAG TPA: hypothetical protein VIS75_03420 [Chitinophagaceae bacterium]
MRKIFFIIICVSIQHITFTGCICQLDPEPYAYSVTIDLLDKITGRTLVASRDSNYYADSMLLETANPLRSYRMAVNKKDTILRSEYIAPVGANFDTLYFRYRTAKTDTIVVYFHSETARACGERFAVIKIDKTIVDRVIACEPCTNYFREPLLIRK